MTHDFTISWGWPQWTIVALLFLRFVITTAQHGEPMIERTGDRKGRPRRYDGFAACSWTAIWISILICGGFFA